MSKQRYVEINDNVKSTWFIERIWQLSESLPTCREVAMHCQRINNADLSYPVILTSDYRVFDGMHRIAKRIMQGEQTILVRRFRQNPKADEVVLLEAEQV